MSREKARPLLPNSISGVDSKDRRRFFIMTAMDSGGANVDPTANRPAAKPPPLPPAASLAYRTAPTESVGWAVAATFANANHWHAANKILSRRGIIAMMRPIEGDAVGFDLLVLQTEVEWARDLLSRHQDAEAEVQLTRGFPVYPIDSPQTASEPSSIRAIPADQRGLSLQQRSRYTVFIIVLWVVLLIVLLITVMGTIYLFNN
jgi:hypothetical protein